MLYHDDSIHQIRGTAHDVDDAVGGIPQRRAIAPPDDREQLAVAFASCYLHVWQ